MAENPVSEGSYLTSLSQGFGTYPLKPDDPVRDTGATAGLSFEQYVAQSRPDIAQIKEDMPDDVRNNVFEQGLSGEVDLQTRFTEPLFINDRGDRDDTMYTAVKEAKAAEDGGTATPEQVALLNEVRTGQARDDFDFLASGDDQLATGFIETGTFPIDPTTGKVVGIDDIVDMPDVPFFGDIGLRGDVQKKAEQGAERVVWMQGRLDAPSSPVIREALEATLGDDFGDILAERMYSLAAASELGVRHYLPNFAAHATDWATGKLFENGTEYGLTEDEAAVDLARLRSAAFFKDRTTFMNDMIREQLRVRLGDEQFNALGLGEKIIDEATGEERFARNFVSDSFANDLFEFMFDQQHFTTKLSMLAAENIAMGGIFRAPFVFGGNATRLATREFLKLNGKQVPFGALSVSDQAILASEHALVKGIPLQVAAKELATNGKSLGWWGKWRANSLATAVGNRAAVQNINASLATSRDKVTELLYKRRKAIQNGDDVSFIDGNIRREISLSNWRTIRKYTVGARAYGVTPMFDTTAAIFMLGGRNMAGGPEGEFYGAASFMGLWAGKNLFQLSGRVPVISTASSTLAFKARSLAESTLSTVGELIPIMNRGRAEGWFLNPNLKSFIQMDDAVFTKLTDAEKVSVTNFAKGFAGMDARTRDFIIDQFDSYYDDIDTVMQTLGPIIGAENSKELLGALTLTVGAATGMNAFFGVAKSLEAHQLPITSGSFSKIERQLRDKLDTQVNAEKQIAAMSAAVDMLDNQVMKLKEMPAGANPNEVRARRMALDQLETLAGSYRAARDFGIRQLDELVTNDLAQADTILRELANPVNTTQRDAAIVSGLVDDLIAIQQRADLRVQEMLSGHRGKVPVRDADGVESVEAIGFEGDAAVRQEGLSEAATNVEQSLARLQAAVVTAHNRGRLAKDAGEIIDTQNATIVDLTKLSLEAGRAEVRAAYAAISDDKTIPLDLFAVGLMDFLNTLKSDVNASVTRSLVPGVMRNLGGQVGTEMFVALNNAAERGMIQFFNNPEVLRALNDVPAFKEMGVSFATGNDVVQVLKSEYYGMNAGVRQSMGLVEGQEISNVQLAIQLMNDPDFAVINANRINFIAHPMELEQLRQFAVKMSAPNRPDAQRNAGNMLVGLIDNVFDNYTANMGPEDLEAIAYARATHRLFKQRTDDGTFGAKVLKTFARGPQRIGEDEVVQGMRSDPTKAIDAMVREIINPTSATPRNVELMMEQLIATYAPTRIPRGVLKQGADGSWRIPSDEELAGLGQVVMDARSYTDLQAIISTGIQNAFLEQSNIGSMYRAFDKNSVPNLRPEDMPKAIQVPERYLTEGKGLADYLADIEGSFVVKVDFGDGKGAVDMPLFDAEDLLMRDRAITDVVNAVPEYTDTHANLIKLAETEREVIASAGETAMRIRTEQLNETLILANATTGESFVRNVVDADSADSMTNFIRRVEEVHVENPEQGKDALKATFVEAIKALGGFSPSTRTVKMFNGAEVPIDVYTNPAEVFAMLDDALTDGSQTGRNLKRLADAAGITEDELASYRAIFGLSFRAQGYQLVTQAGDGTLKSITKGFTLDNALSKAFNLARGMVSKEYVAAEVALRYAALAKGRTLAFLVSDPKATNIVRNLIEDEKSVEPADALYLGQQLMKFVAGDLPREAFDVDVNTEDYVKQYWMNQGMIFDMEIPADTVSP